MFLSKMYRIILSVLKLQNILVLNQVRDEEKKLMLSNNCLINLTLSVMVPSNIVHFSFPGSPTKLQKKQKKLCKSILSYIYTVFDHFRSAFSFELL